jgi:rubrerythrin
MDDVKANIFELAKKFEMSIGELYSLFARTIPKDRELWEKLAQDEQIHANWMDKFQNNYKQKSKEMISNKSSLLQIMNAITDINQYIQKNRNVKITRTEAFKKASELEELALEVFFHEFFSKLPTGDNANILKMIQEQDKRHLEYLKQYIKNR